MSRTDLSVLITGESGVGKEHFPKIIHAYSARKHGPYFAVNCGAIPEGTIDSELFGHEKGAFTDAKNEHKGYFEIADGGTLFLDEVGELPLQTQVRLLRVLETGEFLRMGSSTVRKTNVRVVAATNLDMRQAIHDGRFREDLYYRLNTVEIRVPALRERKEDIPLLFRKFATDFGFDRNLYQFARDGFAPFREEYKAACVNLGRRVTFDLPDGRQGTGEAVDVDEEGRLVVRTDSGEVHVFTGEVSVHGIYGAV